MQKERPHYTNIFWLTLIHLVAIAAIPTFTWGALAVCMILLFTISPIGVTLTYHRLLAHRAFQVPRWLEYSLATFGALSAQGPVMIWVAGHRLHHRYSDTPRDPHNARRGFFYAHMGHLLHKKEVDGDPQDWMRLVPDMVHQKYYWFLNRYHMWIALSILPVLYWFGGIRWVLWGGFVRVVIMFHITWLVNSASHMFGYRRFNTPDLSRNCWWVGLLACGEGWHNNHHARPSCAAHGWHAWWELDVTYLLILALEKVGLAWNVRKPSLMSRSSRDRLVA